MFTGIIETTATVLSKTSRRIVIQRPKNFTDLKIGSSVSVAGVCLSVVKSTISSMQFDVVPETLEKTRLGKLKKAECVNLERAMKIGDRFDGHMVQGHIEGVGLVLGSGSMLHIRAPIRLMDYVFPKGSIAVDGVSLTVAKIDGGHIWIALIPHTLKNTTLGSLKKGDLVNIETDVLTRAALRR